MSGSLFKAKSLCVVTGASRGYGKCIAEMFATRLVSGSHLLLLARNTEHLTQVAGNLHALNKEVKATWSELDMSNLTDCSEENINAIFTRNDINLGDFETVFLIHNAGSIGDLTKFSWEYTDGDRLASDVNLNITGTFLLNAALLTKIRKHDIKNKVVINISSLAAVKPCSSMAFYCAGNLFKTSLFFSLLVR